MSYIKEASKRKKNSNMIMKCLTNELINHESLKLKIEVAIELQAYFESLVELAKQGTLHARRLVASRINSQIENGKNALDKLFRILAIRYKERKGGYTRIIKLDNRRGDNAEIACIALLS